MTRSLPFAASPAPLAAPREVVFRVPGVPVAKARARVVRLKGGGVRAFTPAKTVAYEEAVRWAARAARVPLAGGGIALDVLAVWSFPTSWSQRARREAEAAWAAGAPPWKDTKPDWDNVGKAVADALEGVAYPHDGRVAFGAVATMWGPRSETVVRVRPLDHRDVAWAFAPAEAA